MSDSSVRSAEQSRDKEAYLKKNAFLIPSKYINSIPYSAMDYSHSCRLHASSSRGIHLKTQKISFQNQASLSHICAKASPKQVIHEHLPRIQQSENGPSTTSLLRKLSVPHQRKIINLYNSIFRIHPIC